MKPVIWCLKKDQLDCFKYFKSMINYCEIYFIESYVDTLNIIKKIKYENWMNWELRSDWWEINQQLSET